MVRDELEYEHHNLRILVAPRQIYTKTHSTNPEYRYFYVFEVFV